MSSRRGNNKYTCSLTAMKSTCIILLPGPQTLKTDTAEFLQILLYITCVPHHLIFCLWKRDDQEISILSMITQVAFFKGKIFGTILVLITVKMLNLNGVIDNTDT